MKTLYTEDPPFDGKGMSIFLAGPTPRDSSTPSWRPLALECLDCLGFEGTAIVPERRLFASHIDFDSQVEWEHAGLELSTIVAFWVPRDLERMPAFTTNIEAGRIFGRRPSIYGRPPEAPKNDYLDWFYEKMTNKRPLNTLQDTMSESVAHARKWGSLLHLQDHLSLD